MRKGEASMSSDFDDEVTEVHCMDCVVQEWERIHTKRRTRDRLRTAPLGSRCDRLVLGGPVHE
jgi:hypothetical protein